MRTTLTLNNTMTLSGDRQEGRYFMVGYPKYRIGDIVKFKVRLPKSDELIEKTGTVAIVDKYGTFFNDSDVSYDICVKEEKILYKHFSEPCIIEKIGNEDPNKIWEL